MTLNELTAPKGTTGLGVDSPKDGDFYAVAADWKEPDSPVFIYCRSEGQWTPAPSDVLVKDVDGDPEYALADYLWAMWEYRPIVSGEIAEALDRAVPICEEGSESNTPG